MYKCCYITDECCYLGIPFRYNNKFSFSQKHLADQGRKALFALHYKCKHLSVNCKTMLHLFDTYITSILCYSCEVWGFCKGIEVENDMVTGSEGICRWWYCGQELKPCC